MPDAITPTHVQLAYGRHGRRERAFPNPDNPGNPFARPSAFAHLDATRYWSEVWAPLPAPFDGDYRLPGLDLDVWPEEYVQTAGRRGRLTVETRQFVRGAFRQYVVGRTPATDVDPSSDPSEIVHWSEFSVRVFPHEVWTSTRATRVFRHWFEHRTLPTDLVLRELDPDRP